MSYRTTFGDLEATERDVLSLPPPSVPMEVAREFADARYRHPVRGADLAVLARRLVAVADRALGRDRAARDAGRRLPLHRARRLRRTTEEESRKPWAPNRHKVADLLDALAAVVHLPEDVSMPAWLDGTALRRPARLVRERAARRRHARAARAHAAVLQRDERPVRLRPDAPPPRPLASRSWASCGRTTPTSSAALQEWFGYVISRPARPAQDPAARRADAGREGRDRPHPRRAGRRRERRRSDALQPERRLRPRAAARQVARRRLRRAAERAQRPRRRRAAALDLAARTR